MARTAVRLALLLSIAGCNERTELFTGPGPTAPSVVYNIRFDPPGVIAGQSSTGIVRLSLPAPPGGMAVSLSSSDPAVASVPPSITVPQGAETGTFAVTTRGVSADRPVTMTAATPARAATGRLFVWAILPTFFLYASDPGDSVGAGGMGRFVPPSSFMAQCNGSDISINVSGGTEFWSVRLGAPRGSPLRVGTYEGATRTAFRAPGVPGIDVAGGGGCSTMTGRFVVHESDLAPDGTVRQFWASFEQHCDGRTPALRGDVRVTNGARPASHMTCTVP